MLCTVVAVVTAAFIRQQLLQLLLLLLLYFRDVQVLSSLSSLPNNTADFWSFNHRTI
jgi:hypothetical protein